MHYLTEIIVDPNNPVYEDRGVNAIFNKLTNTLVLGCSSTTIPEGVAEIQGHAFFRRSISEINLPESIKKIGSFAFSGCENLIEITINGNISTLSSTVFQSCTNLTKLTLGANVTSLPDSLFGTDNLTELNEIVVEAESSLSAALPTYGEWVKEGGDTVTSFSGAGTYTRTNI